MRSSCPYMRFHLLCQASPLHTLPPDRLDPGGRGTIPRAQLQSILLGVGTKPEAVERILEDQGCQVDYCSFLRCLCPQP